MSHAPVFPLSSRRQMLGPAMTPLPSALTVLFGAKNLITAALSGLSCELFIAAA